jgi:hypothetical protein
MITTMALRLLVLLILVVQQALSRQQPNLCHVLRTEEASGETQVLGVGHATAQLPLIFPDDLDELDGGARWANAMLGC